VIYLRPNPERVPAAAPARVPAPEPARCVAIVGVGVAGCRLVQRHQLSVAASPPMPNWRHLAVHTDRDTITRIQAMSAILLHADASGVAAVMPWLADCKALYVLADMGDWRSGGSLATPALVRLAREACLHTVALVGMPCVWEGERRNTAALHALESLRECATETVVVHGDAVAERFGEDATLDQFVAAFDAALLEELDGRLATKARLR
jgi:hypothetical protein